MASTIIQEFIQSLDEEIKAIKKGGGGSVTKIFNGRFLREVSGLFVYVFNLENFLAVLGESPAEIEIRGKKFPAQVLSTQGSEIEIGIEHSCGHFIPEAKLQTNLWYLLELLKKKYIECQSGSAKADFHLSELVFSGQQSNYKSTDKIEIYYSSSIDPPNEAQKKAIEASFISRLSIIWGPPGTGKTKTIAQAIEAHLNAGRRVLLVSHANNAVDEALEQVAKHLKPTPFYQEGKLVRLGIPQHEHLMKITEEGLELVLLDKIAEKLGESLTKEKNMLEIENTRLDEVLSRFNAAFQAVQMLKTLSSELDALKSGISESMRELNRVSKDLVQLEESQIINKDKLTEAQSCGRLKKIFKGLNPQKIQREIDKTSVAIDSKRRVKKEIKAQLDELENLKMQKVQKVNGIKREIDILTNQDSSFGDSDIVECSRCNTKNRVKQYAENIKPICGKCKAELPSYSKRTYSVEELEKMKIEFNKRKDIVLARIAEINTQLDELQKKILSEAKLVATTLTKTFVAKQFPDKPFDVLILDEASMSPLPHLYWAISRCCEFVTIVGDFLQLPPICIAKETMAHKWLGRSIFEVLGINSVKEALSDHRINLLKKQYRMAHEISTIPNRFFYENKLEDDLSTFNRRLDDGVSDSPLVLIETATMNPWCSRLSTGGRFNLYNALVCATLARKIIAHIERIRKDCNNPNAKVGIITPYKDQSRLINKIIMDWKLSDLIRVSTVHRFQGGEEPIIIFDSCEGPGVRVAPMLDDTKHDSDARLVLNVAITRTKNRFYFVGHTKHLLSDLHRDSVLARIIHYFYEEAEVLDSGTLVDKYFTTDFEKWADALISTTSATREPFSGDLHTEKNFWQTFYQDLKIVKERLIILSPFVTVQRSGRLIDYFRAMIERGIEIRIYTRPKNQQTGEMANQADIVIEQLRGIGAKVIERRSMHQKVAILDNAIAWEGSLNILSHRDTGEQMRRFEGLSAIEDIIRNLELDEDMPVGNQTEEKCPVLGCDGFLVVRSKFGRKFLGCSNYAKRKCNYTRSI